MTTLRTLGKKLGFVRTTMEDNVVELLKQNPQVYIEPAIAYFQTCDKFTGHGRDYLSPSGNVHVCMDIYGPEVKIGNANELLDCCPEAYGLDKEQGKRLYEAILSCVPGTVHFAERVGREIADAKRS